MSNPFDWPFLQEPLWRWFIFIIALTLFTITWNGVLEFMRS